MAQQGAEQKFRFLIAIIQSLITNSNDPQMTCSLIRQNLVLLDDEMIEVLKDWAITEFSRAKESEQKIISQALIVLGDVLRKLPTGNKAVYIEISIKCYSLASRVLQSNINREKWVEIQKSLAVAYQEKIRGDKAENLEFSIECYKFVLNAYCNGKPDLELAEAHNNLAIAYKKRLRGHKNENMKLSIDYYKLAQEILIKIFESTVEFYNPNDFSTIWAMSQNNLANAYRERISGDRVENLQMSVNCYELVLDFYGKNALYTVLSETQYSLSNVYKEQLEVKQVNEQSLVDLNSQLANAYYSRGIFKEYKLNDISRALNDYSKVIQLDAQNANIYTDKKYLKKRSFNDLQKTLLNYDGIIKLYPENLSAHYNRAILKQTKLNDSSGALSDYNKALELDYQYADVYFSRGTLKHTKFNDVSGALIDYKIAIKSILSFSQRNQNTSFTWRKSPTIYIET